MRQRNVSTSAGGLASLRLLSVLLLPWALLLASGACIRRSAAPPLAGPAAATGAPAPAPNRNAALEAANARIAGVTRVDLLGGAGVKAFAVSGEASKVALTPLAVEGQPFTDAIRATVKEGSSHEWAVQLRAVTASAVETGDVLLATFYLRAETPQEGSVGETEFVVELAGAPYTKSVSYPVQLGSAWTKVQVRFLAARAYAPGEAQILFRMGYEPEVLDIGGVSVETFGKQLALSALPSTLGEDRRREKTLAAAAKPVQVSTTPVNGGELRFEVAPTQVVGPISPYVYGINSQKNEGAGATVRRTGGNRQTAYNWENNASSAGSDYNHSSDEWSCTALGYHDCDQPGAQFVDFALENRKAGIESMVTIPLVDYVAADKRGSVSEKDKAPSSRWNRSFAVKPGPFAPSPDLSDGKVYQDELVDFLTRKLGTADKGGIRFYSLDNEPALWPSTHPRVHPEKTRYDEMVTRSEATAAAITKIDPSAVVLGAVAFGWSEYMSLNSAPDAAKHNAQYGTYLDFFLASMKALEAKHHRRLVHGLDVHWYPEAKGTKRITEKDVSPKTVVARLQAPRSLWDPTYVEKSWIAAEWGKPIRLIPWLHERIAERYPGTKLSMTEYDFGAPDHISGGLAQADVLGIFGREGLFLGTYWGQGAGNAALPGYISAAFKLYRNADGKGGTFGDISVQASPGDIAKASIYAAVDSKRPGLLTIVVINKDLNAIFDGKIDIKGGGYGKARVYTLDSRGPEIRAQPAVDIKNDRITYRLSPLSATLFVCERG